MADIVHMYIIDIYTNTAEKQNRYKIGIEQQQIGIEQVQNKYRIGIEQAQNKYRIGIEQVQNSYRIGIQQEENGNRIGISDICNLRIFENKGYFLITPCTYINGH